MKKKVAFITGASKGIGLACAKMLASAGYTVYGGARSPFNEPGIIPVTIDVTDPQSVSAAQQLIRAAEGRIDVVVNNAGMGISGPVEYTKDSDARYIFDVNFFGVFLVTKAFIPLLRDSGGGKIINISSVASQLSIPFQSFYSSTKAAVDAMTYALRAELKPHKITAVAIMPGDTKTSFTDARQKCSLPHGGDALYGERINRSVELMERDERGGMPPEKTAKLVYKMCRRKNPPPAVTVGGKYKLFLVLNKVLPRRFVNFIIAKMYG